MDTDQPARRVATAAAPRGEQQLADTSHGAASGTAAADGVASQVLQQVTRFESMTGAGGDPVPRRAANAEAQAPGLPIAPQGALDAAHGAADTSGDASSSPSAGATPDVQRAAVADLLAQAGEALLQGRATRVVATIAASGLFTARLELDSPPVAARASMAPPHPLPASHASQACAPPAPSSWAGISAAYRPASMAASAPFRASGTPNTANAARNSARGAASRPFEPTTVEVKFRRPYVNGKHAEMLRSIHNSSKDAELRGDNHRLGGPAGTLLRDAPPGTRLTGVDHRHAAQRGHADFVRRWSPIGGCERRSHPAAAEHHRQPSRAHPWLRARNALAGRRGSVGEGVRRRAASAGCEMRHAWGCRQREPAATRTCAQRFGDAGASGQAQARGGIVPRRGMPCDARAVGARRLLRRLGVVPAASRRAPALQ